MIAWLAFTVLDYYQLEREFTDFGKILIPEFSKTVMVTEKFTVITDGDQRMIQQLEDCIQENMLWAKHGRCS